MSKNKHYHPTKRRNPVLETLKYCEADKHMIEMYAAFVIVLKEHWEKNGQTIPDDDIEYLLACVQDEWNKSVIGNYSLVEKCETQYDFKIYKGAIV